MQHRCWYQAENEAGIYDIKRGSAKSTAYPHQWLNLMQARFNQFHTYNRKAFLVAYDFSVTTIQYFKGQIESTWKFQS